MDMEKNQKIKISFTREELRILVYHYGHDVGYGVDGSFGDGGTLVDVYGEPDNGQEWKKGDKLLDKLIKVQLNN